MDIELWLNSYQRSTSRCMYISFLQLFYPLTLSQYAGEFIAPEVPLTSQSLRAATDALGLCLPTELLSLMRSKTATHKLHSHRLARNLNAAGQK